EDGIRDDLVTGVQTCALPISGRERSTSPRSMSQRLSAPKRWKKRSRPMAPTKGGRMSGTSKSPVNSPRPANWKRVNQRASGRVRSEERRVGKEGRWREGEVEE